MSDISVLEFAGILSPDVNSLPDDDGVATLAGDIGVLQMADGRELRIPSDATVLNRCGASQFPEMLDPRPCRVLAGSSHDSAAIDWVWIEETDKVAGRLADVRGQNAIIQIMSDTYVALEVAPGAAYRRCDQTSPESEAPLLASDPRTIPHDAAVVLDQRGRVESAICRYRE